MPSRLLFVLSLCLCSAAQAVVTKIEVLSSVPFAEGRTFGDVGVYARIAGRFYGPCEQCRSVLRAELYRQDPKRAQEHFRRNLDSLREHLKKRRKFLLEQPEIKKGTIMAQVKLDVPASKMASVMTVDSLDEMDLKKGDKVRVIVKAIHVLLLKD